jgi:hypothetical protein
MDFIQDMQAARSNTSSFPCSLKDIIPKNKEYTEIRGKQIPIAKSAFTDLLKIAGITNAMLMHLNETINPQAGFQLVQMLNKAIDKTGNTKVHLIVDKEKQEVVRIGSLNADQTAAVPAGAIEELLRELTNTDKIKLNQTLITDSGTKVSFNLSWDVNIPLKMPGENISFGKQITWDMFGDITSVDMIERLICTNGLTGIVPGNKPDILNAESDPSSWYNALYMGLQNPNAKVIKHYESKVREAMQTALSAYEFNKIKGLALTIWKDDVEKIIRHIGDDKDWKLKYEQKGINLEKTTSAQLRNCPTPVNAWDAINMLTDLASHTYTTPVSASSKKLTQRMAGQILNSTFDENSWIDNVPKFGNVSKLK